MANVELGELCEVLGLPRDAEAAAMLQAVRALAKRPEPGVFLKALVTLEKGMALPDLDASLAQLVMRVLEVRKGGTLSVKIAVKPRSKASGNDLVVEMATPRVQLPQPDRTETVFFGNPADGDIGASPFEQQALDFDDRR